MSDQPHTWVCFDCRTTGRVTPQLGMPRCPRCRWPMIDCGSNFQTPKKNHDRSWRSAKEWAKASGRIPSGR